MFTINPYIILLMVSVVKFAIIGTIFVPYLLTQNSLLSKLQIVSTVGVGILGLQELFVVYKQTITDVIQTIHTILAFIHIIPFVTICWMLNIVNSTTVSNDEYNMSVYIVVCFFSTHIWIIVSCLLLLIRSCFDKHTEIV